MKFTESIKRKEQKTKWRTRDVVTSLHEQNVGGSCGPEATAPVALANAAATATATATAAAAAAAAAAVAVAADRQKRISSMYKNYYNYENIRNCILVNTKYIYI